VRLVQDVVWPIWESVDTGLLCRSLQSVGTDKLKSKRKLNFQVACNRLLGRSSDSGQENRDYSLRGTVALITRHPLYPLKLALTSATSGCRSIGIVRSRTKAMELVIVMNSSTI
jgi:hypothetical protein